MRALRAGPGVLFPILFAAGCAQSAAPVDDRVVVDSAGVEIVTVPTLPSLNDPDYRWQSDVELEIHTQPDGGLSEPIIYDPGLIVPISDDTLIVVDDPGPDPLVVLAVPDGEVVRRLGSRGEGPLELSSVDAVWRDASGTIHVLDRPLRKVVSFAPDGGSSVASIDTEGGMPINAANPDRRDGPPVVAYGTAVADGFLNFGVGTLERTDSTFVPRQILSLPHLALGYFRARNVWTAVPGGIVAFRTDEPEYRVLNRDGELVRLIRVPLSERVVSAREEQRIGARLSGSAETAGLAPPDPGSIAMTNNVYPLGDSIFGTFQSDMWRAAEDDIPADTPLLRLFSTSGRYMGTLYEPNFFQIRWFGGGIAWVVAEDSIGIPVIQRRRMIPPPGIANR